jgi:hypothetical protein
MRDASVSHSARDFRSCAHQQGADRGEDSQALTRKDTKGEIGKRGACKLFLDEANSVYTGQQSCGSRHIAFVFMKSFDQHPFLSFHAF